MKNSKYYEEMGIDYNNSGVVSLVYCMDTVGKIVKTIVSKLK